MQHVRFFVWDRVVLGVGTAFGIKDVRPPDGVLLQAATLRAQNTRLSAELRDYRTLRLQLGTPSVDSLQAIGAGVLARPIDTFQNEFVLTKGVRDGVVMGSPVVVHGSILVGFITEVSEHTSVLRLLTHPAVVISAEAISPDEGMLPGRGLLRGDRFTAAMLTTVPRDIVLAADSAVVTTATEQIPYGLIVGTIQEVINKENEPYQSANVSLPYDATRLRAVYILVHP